ncbi:hypothetical protein LP418_23855 [Nocardioides sp. B-3]|nr:hypothetical protein LP418_23855 [Nocardioides sp. B-3]
MDRATAQALVDAGVAAVLNAAPMISGRYPNLGPDVLIRAGIPVLDTFGPEIVARIKDGTRLRIHEGEVFDGPDSVAVGRVVDAEVVRGELESARVGLTSQLESFTHNSTEFLRREQDLLLHGRGVPRTVTHPAGRPVVVVVCGHDWEAELTGIKAFIREQDPVLIGVDDGADGLRGAGYKPHIVVANATNDELPSIEVLKKARGRDRARRARSTGCGDRTLRPHRRAPAALRDRSHDGGRGTHPRGRRAGQPHHRRRHARDARRVPRPTSHRSGQHLPHPAQGRTASGRCGRRPAPLRRPGSTAPPAGGDGRGHPRPRRRHRRHPGGPGSGRMPSLRSSPTP